MHFTTSLRRFLFPFASLAGLAAVALSASGCTVHHYVDHMHVEVYDEMGGFNSHDCPIARVTYEQGSRRGELPADFDCTFTDLYHRPYANDDVYAEEPITFFVDTYDSSPYRSFAFTTQTAHGDDALYTTVRVPRR